jgi:hypothetical protein
LDEPVDDRESRTEEIFDFLAGAVRCAKPNELRRLAVENAAFLKVRILGNDGEVIVPGVLPNGGMVRASQSASMNMNRTGINIR